MFKLLLFFILTSNIYAFYLSGSVLATYDIPEVTVDVGSTQCAGFPDTPEEILSMVNEAGKRFWNPVATSALEIRSGAVINVDADFYTQQICNTGAGCVPEVTMSDVLIVCNNNAVTFPGSSILGVTLTNYSSGTTILGTVIALNANDPSKYEALSRDNKIAVIAHELGHAIGLGHSQFKTALMYSKNVLGRTKLGRDDWNGATALYPKKQPLGGACGTITTNIDKNDRFRLSFLVLMLLILASFAQKTLFSKQR